MNEMNGDQRKQRESERLAKKWFEWNDEFANIMFVLLSKSWWFSFFLSGLLKRAVAGFFMPFQS
jgi:hypothetical protein